MVCPAAAVDVNLLPTGYPYSDIKKRLPPKKDTLYSRQLVTRATPIGLGVSRQVDGGVSVCQGVGYSPWGVICASIGTSSITRGFGVIIGQWIVALVT